MNPGGLEVVDRAGQPLGDVDHRAVRVHEALQVDPVVFVLTRVVQPVGRADTVGMYDGAVEDEEVALGPREHPDRPLLVPDVRRLLQQ